MPTRTALIQVPSSVVELRHDYVQRHLWEMVRARPGNPRLGAVETKTWMRGSSPRKTTSNSFLRVRNRQQIVALHCFSVMAGLDPAISGAPLDPRVKPAGDGT